MKSVLYERKAPVRTAEIICVGTELLLGDVINTNAAFLSRKLADMGISVYHQTVVGDHPGRLQHALEDAFSGNGGPACDLVILSGGLGPTYDDLTKETVAQYFGRSMYLHEESLTRIRAYFSRLNRPMTPNNEKQAMMPEGAVVFPNDFGTAPALAVGTADRTAVMLPGPPCELEPLFDTQIAPWLRQYTESILLSKNIYILGMGESEVEYRLKDLMMNAVNPTLAPYCGHGEVRLRVTAKAETLEKAGEMCDEMIETVAKTDCGSYIYGIDIGNVETALVRTLTKRALTISCAESCTGGMIGERITDVPGASAVFAGGMITYTNDIKIKLLGVDPHTIAQHTEVSLECAAEMAAGARRVLGTDLAISTTGYAGPGGGTERDPVGTVYVGIATQDGARAYRLSYSSGKTREFIRKAAASKAMMLLLEAIR
ncbi:MAG: competence/damage-inducible protein A [Clostridia bacterium]|nr:competence/damage-inducible protein A [Clostridia bacterium]